MVSRQRPHIRAHRRDGNLSSRQRRRYRSDVANRQAV